MAKRKKTKSHRKSRRKSAPRKRRVVVVRKTVIRVGSRRSKGSAVSRAKATIRRSAEEVLKDGLFARDKATTRKQHRAAQKRITAARKELRRFK